MLKGETASIIIHLSVQNKVCDDKECKMPHLKSSRKNDGKFEKRSSGRTKVIVSPAQNSSKSADSEYKAYFLEVKELVENMNLSLGKFQEELNQVKASLHPTPRTMSPVGHPGQYPGHPSQYPGHWPMLFTPPLSC